MAGFGAGAFGSTAFGSGGGVTIQEAEQLTRNTLRVRFAGPVAIQNRGFLSDALYDRGYTLMRYSDPRAHVPRVVWSSRETSSSVVLALDAELDGPGILYRIVASEALSGLGTPLSLRSALFHTFGEVRSTVSRPIERTFDLVPPKVDDDGDYANDAGLENLKKRVLRRLTTRRGAFLHLPNYGLRVAIKGKTSAGLLRDLQAQALEQIRTEPGVSDVRVAVSMPVPGIVRLSIEVEAGRLGFGEDVDLPIQEGGGG